MTATLAMLLADGVYISGGAIFLLLLIFLVVWVARRA